MQLIDSHAHLTSSDVLPRLDPILERAQAAQLFRIVNVCTDIKSLEAGLELEKRCPWIRNAGSTTPPDAETAGAAHFGSFAAAARSRQLVAIGETGLDYYYQPSNPKIQQEFFIRYLHLAVETHLPIIFHCRNAFDDLFAITDRELPKGHPAIVHCFTGGLKDANRAIDRGWMLSLSGILTFKNSQALRTVVESIPLDALLIETDTPFLAPHKHRGQPNEPSFIIETLASLAALKHQTLEQMAQITTENARKVFQI